MQAFHRSETLPFFSLTRCPLFSKALPFLVMLQEAAAVRVTLADGRWVELLLPFAAAARLAAALAPSESEHVDSTASLRTPMHSHSPAGS